ncbi:MAG: lysine--tRNA ligase [Gammaproteobacteria bacterium]|nr:lysine--tRNA ligase [Gammaproteobacteria bacterium]
MSEDNILMAQRREKLTQMRADGIAFPNDFKPTHRSGTLHAAHDWTHEGEITEEAKDALKAQAIEVKMAGRLMSKRVMGKASFAQIQDEDGRIQVYLARDSLPEGQYPEFKGGDIGDIVAVEGTLFYTKTGELSVNVSQFRTLVKSLRPLPEKFHGIADQEMKYRQRYVDLIMTEQTRTTFKRRSAIINAMRQLLNDDGYLEIESPMMQAIPGGATAKPFITHHNALDRDLYMRVAQELALKRCIVGGFEKVYELNRVFRNEGLSARHNPEFTMLEYNAAYEDYQTYIDLTEALVRAAAMAATGSLQIEYQGETVDLAPAFARKTMLESVLEAVPELTAEDFDDSASAVAAAARVGIKVKEGMAPGLVLVELFDAKVEHNLRQPTFITDYPVEISPLARPRDDNPMLTERWELFCVGRELANGFSELNDPEVQAERFAEQVAQKDAGDDEAMYFDHDYVRALEYGLPPNAGGGIGVDRLVMLLTDSPSIRDVLLFPHMRPEATQ